MCKQFLITPFHLREKKLNKINSGMIFPRFYCWTFFHGFPSKFRDMIPDLTEMFGFTTVFEEL